MEDNYLTIGKVPEKLLSRWVFSAPAAERPEVLQGPGLGEDCAAIELAAGEILILSTDPITATEENIGYLAVHVTLNDLAAAGAAPIGLMATILLPPNYPESRLEQIFMELRQTAAAHLRIRQEQAGKRKTRTGKTIRKIPAEDNMAASNAPAQDKTPQEDKKTKKQFTKKPKS